MNFPHVRVIGKKLISIIQKREIEREGLEMYGFFYGRKINLAVHSDFSFNVLYSSSTLPLSFSLFPEADAFHKRK